MRSLMLFSLVAGCATAPQRAATQATASEPARQTLRTSGVSVIQVIDTSLPTIASPTSSPGR